MDGNRRRIHRYFDDLLKTNIEKYGIVILEGPLAVGKTETALFLNPNIITLEEINDKGLNILLEPQSNNGSNIFFIDEYQTKFEIYTFLVENRDKIIEKGYHYLLVSSFLPKIKRPYEGMDETFVKRIKMLGLSNYESEHSNGAISLDKILRGEYIISDNLGNSYGDDLFIDLIYRGSYPYTNINKDLSEEDCVKWIIDYFLSMKPRLKVAENKFINIESISRVLRALARNECSLCSNAYLIDDIYDNENYQIEPNTVNNYVNLLNKIYLFDNIASLPDDKHSPMNKYLKIKQVPKRRYFDTSINVVTLELLKNEINTPELRDIYLNLIKSMTIKDLKIYLTNNDNFDLYSYQDYLFNLVDIVFKSNEDGEYVACDVVIDEEDVPASIEKLEYIRKTIIEHHGNRFNKFIIFVANLDKAYLAKENFYICPILALKD